MSFQNKVVIVTGASSGIGAAIAIKFSEEGAQISLVGRNQNKLNNVARQCGNPLVLIADVSKDADAKRIVDDTVQRFGQLDILINNAGIGLNAAIWHEHAMRVFDQVMATNLRAPVLITSFAVPHLIKTKGNIINISSVGAVRALFKHSFSYNTSKAALDQFTRAVALELASSGVRVNTVNPGPVKTDILENMGATESQAEAIYKIMEKATALGRVSESEEIADLVMFLASNKAKGVTGSSYVTDNGMMIVP